MNDLWVRMSACSQWRLGLISARGGSEGEMGESFGASSIELGCEIGKDSPEAKGRDRRKGSNAGRGDEGAVKEPPVNVARRMGVGGRESARPDLPCSLSTSR